MSDSSGLAYTQGSCSGVYCHSSVEWSTPGPVPVPGVDFPFDGIYPISYPDYAVVSTRTFAEPTWGGSLSCDGCHGFPPRTYSDQVEAGAGDSHSWADENGDDNLHAWNHGYTPLACATCHTKTVSDFGVRGFLPGTHLAFYEPVAIQGHDLHVNGSADVAFTKQKVTLNTDHDLSTASYDAAERSCSSVSCHKKETEAKWGDPFRWWVPYECNKCHQI
jgi:predicted CxxxxCH...CXXCH cytochrome family protein